MNDKNPLVSVITVCLNSARSISRTIESVLAQTYPHIEYIIVDGGSTDGTLEIVRRYGERIATIISEPDRGISDAFNKGIRAARGEYIQFINADDTLDKDKIAHSLKAFARTPDAAFVFGDIIKIDEKGTREYFRGDPDYAKSFAYVMSRVNHPSMLVPRALFDRFGLFDERWKIAMDYDWILRLHHAGLKGFYSSDIIVYATAGGVSDAERFRAFRECRDISIRHGMNKPFAYFYYLMRIIKHLLMTLTGRR